MRRSVLVWMMVAGTLATALALPRPLRPPRGLLAVAGVSKTSPACDVCGQGSGHFPGDGHNHGHFPGDGHNHGHFPGDGHNHGASGSFSGSASGSFSGSGSDSGSASGSWSGSASGSGSGSGSGSFSSSWSGSASGLSRHRRSGGLGSWTGGSTSNKPGSGNNGGSWNNWIWQQRRLLEQRRFYFQQTRFLSPWEIGSTEKNQRSRKTEIQIMSTLRSGQSCIGKRFCQRFLEWFSIGKRLRIWVWFS
nr:cell wall protein IFF6-like [Penaeus vannamei]